MVVKREKCGENGPFRVGGMRVEKAKQSKHHFSLSFMFRTLLYLSDLWQNSNFRETFKHFLAFAFDRSDTGELFVVFQIFQKTRENLEKTNSCDNYTI